MKKHLWAVALISACLASCQGTVDPDAGKVENPDDGLSELTGTITLYTDKDIIKADGEHSAKLTVLLTDKTGEEHDVTSDVEIYYEGAANPLESSDFRTTTEGEYVFYAVRGFDITEKVSVRALKGVPDLPADTDEDCLFFKHRMMLLQHTGNECPNCPRLMNVLKEIAADESYAPLYHHVASHSYNTSDAAYSSAASSLSKVMNPEGYYPWLSYGLAPADDYDTLAGYETDIVEAEIDRRSKDLADVGICASAVLADNSVYVNVGIKSALSSKYRVAVWLLEDSIRSIQAGATASWQNMHENCLRAMYGDTKNECIYGKNIGTVEEGKTSEMIAAIDLEDGWVADNCKVIVLAVSGNGDYELLNCTVCPVGGSVSYEYL